MEAAIDRSRSVALAPAPPQSSQALRYPGGCAIFVSPAAVAPTSPASVPKSPLKLALPSYRLSPSVFVMGPRISSEAAQRKSAAYAARCAIAARQKKGSGYCGMPDP